MWPGPNSHDRRACLPRTVRRRLPPRGWRSFPHRGWQSRCGGGRPGPPGIRASSVGWGKSDDRRGAAAPPKENWGMTVSSRMKTPAPARRPGQALLSGQAASRIHRIVIVETGVAFVAVFRLGPIVFTILAGHRVNPAGPGRPARVPPLPAPPASAGRAPPDKRRCRP